MSAPSRIENSVRFEPLDAIVGAVVHGVDVGQELTPPARVAIEEALEKYGVLIFRDQHITPDQQVRFCRTFGELDLPPRVEDRQSEHPEIFVIGNPDKKAVIFAPDTDEDEPEDGELEWHADHSQYAEPTWISMLYGVEVPPVGGDTVFACTYSSYDALDEETKRRYEDVLLLHSVRGLNDYLRDLGKSNTISEIELELEKEPPQRWPLVRTHPLSGRKALYWGSRMSIGAVGMSEEDGKALIREVTEFATQPRFVYRHKWQPRDVVLWDNRRAAHAATSFNAAKYTRVIHRTTVKENAPVR
jgi:alpha-ketoglutarate-dependent taurine dioxygenase